MQNNQDNSSEEKTLLDELKQATEKKNVSANQIKSWKFEEAEMASDQEPNAETDAPADTTNKPGLKKLTADQIKASAVASTAMVELLTVNLNQAIIYILYHFKLTGEERELIKTDLLFKDFNNLSEPHQFLVRKYKHTKEERDLKIEKISPDKAARARMEQAFIQYTELTGQTFVTPKTNLAVCLLEGVAKSVIGAVID